MDGWLGVDFGTSHTVAALRQPDGRSRILLLDSGTGLLASAVFADVSGELLTGREALRRAASDPSRLEPHPKQRVDEATLLLGVAEYRTVDLVAAVLRRAAAEAVRVAGGLPSTVVLTHPAAWGPPRRQVLLDAALAAGLGTPQLVAEPVAAALYFTVVLGHRIDLGRPVCVFDFGGGTLDVAVVCRQGYGYDVLANGGLADLGGLDLDAAVVAYLDTLLGPDWAQQSRRLAQGADADARLARRRLWDEVRAAKESLSRNSSAPIEIPGRQPALHVTRDEFERVVAPLVERAVAETGRIIAAAGCRPPDLAGLFLVGGSSRVPLVARMLHARLGVPPTVLEQPEIVVAEGAVHLTSPAPAPPAPVPAGPPSAPLSTPPVSAPASVPPATAYTAAPTFPVSTPSVTAPVSARQPVAGPPVPPPSVTHHPPGPPSATGRRRRPRVRALVAVGVAVLLVVVTGIFVWNRLSTSKPVLHGTVSTLMQEQMTNLDPILAECHPVDLANGSAQLDTDWAERLTAPPAGAQEIVYCSTNQRGRSAQLRSLVLILFDSLDNSFKMWQQSTQAYQMASIPGFGSIYRRPAGDDRRRDQFLSNQSLYPHPTGALIELADSVDDADETKLLEACGKYL
ncbi:Hsp70 family protein [Dactylosporangium darangshiense]|uniref:Hsp70 protein n=1 Tax=Dactylosporangium darangshiense TaxID=579108 RepID=A0ABP8DBV2_9ACTN